MRLARAIPLLAAGAAAAWFVARRNTGERPAPMQYQPPRAAPRPEHEPREPEHEPRKPEREPPAQPPAPPADRADQPTTEAPAVEDPDPLPGPADVTSVVDDLVAPDPGNGEIVDADVVDDEA